MLVSIHNHFNLRELAKIELSTETMAKIDDPPPLTPRKEIVVRRHPVTGAPSAEEGEIYDAEPHIVRVPTPHGEMVLFKVKGNGHPFVVTTTPDVVIAYAGAR